MPIAASRPSWYPRAVSVAMTSNLPSWSSLGPDARRFLASRAASACALGTVIVLINLYLEALGLGTAFIGTSLAVFSVGVVMCAAVAGSVADVLGPRRVMVAGEAALAFALLFQLSSTDPAHILCFSWLGGVATALVTVSAAPLMSLLASPGERQHLFSGSYAVFLGMGVAGNLLAGVLPGLVGGGDAAAFRTVLSAAAGLNLLAAWLLLGVGDAPAAPASPGSSPSAPMRMAPIAAFGGIRFLVGLGAGLSVGFLNLYFKRSYGLGTFEIGVLFAVQSLLAAGAATTGPALARRVGRAEAICLLQGLSFPLLVAMASCPPLPVAAAAFCLRSMTMRSATPLFRGLVMDSVPAARRGLASSAVETSWHGGHAVGTWAGGLLIERLGGFGAPFVVTALVYAGAVGALWLWKAAPEAAGDTAPLRPAGDRL